MKKEASKTTRRLLTILIVFSLSLSSLPISAKASDTGSMSKLMSLIVHTGSSPSNTSTLLKNENDTYTSGEVFSPEQFSYQLAEQIDTNTQLRFRAAVEETGAKAVLHYEDAGGAAQTKDITWTSGSSKWVNCLKAGRNELSIVVTPAEGSDKSEATYTFTVDCLPTLTGLTAKADNNEVYLDKTFTAATKEYTLTIPEEAKEISFAAVPKNADYEITYNGETSSTVDITGKDSVDIAVSVGEDLAKVTNHYTVLLQRTETAAFSFVTEPTDTLIKVYDANGAEIFRDQDGNYRGLTSVYQYTYTATKKGYISDQNVIPAEGGKISVILEKAKANEEVKADIPSSWPTFRGSNDNNCITAVKTPKNADEATLYWAKKLGEGYGSGATGSPIIVGDYLVCTFGTKIIKANRFTGEVVASGEMTAKSSFNIIPPVYGDGMIFVGLANGQVQAFNADTLASLWIYKDSLGGQPNSPLMYEDGYLYTGFWLSETKNAHFVCLSATDENPDDMLEEKAASWIYTTAGGFYWAGACIQGDYVLVGTDDGFSGSTSSTAKLLSFDKNTGKVIDKIDGFYGDIRSSVTYDEVTNRYYFTTKGGYFCSVSLNKDGTFGKDETAESGYDVKKLKIGNMSTSTPVVYNGRAYVGVSGGENFSGNFSIVVIDLESFEIAYQARTQGYVQTSGLLTKGYEDEDGYVYIYFIENAKQGKVRVLKDKTGVTAVLDAVTEADNKGDEMTDCAPVLFTPSGEQAQYAICSVISDEYGTLYFKNDSAYMMAVGSKITEIEAMKTGKLHYVEGESFDIEGLSVTAHLINGLDRDVTGDVTVTGVSPAALTTDDTDITIYYNRVMYGDALNGGKENLSNQVAEPLETTVNVQVISKEEKAVADRISDKIAAIGAVTLASEETVKEARKEYDALGEALRPYVENYEQLEKAEGVLAELLNPTPTPTPTSKPTPTPTPTPVPTANPGMVSTPSLEGSVTAAPTTTPVIAPTTVPEKKSVEEQKLKKLPAPKSVVLKRFGKGKKKIKVTFKKVNNAKAYIIKLYRNKKLIRKITISRKKSGLDISRYMKKKGTYYVSVTAKGSKEVKNSAAKKSKKLKIGKLKK